MRPSFGPRLMGWEGSRVLESLHRMEASLTILVYGDKTVVQREKSLAKASCLYFFIFCFLFSSCLFIFERDRARVGEGQRERGRHRISAGSRLRAVSTEPDAGLELMNCEVMT